MRWIDPGDPLPSAARSAVATPPAVGALAWDEVNWHQLPGGLLGISPRTGGWALFDPAERATLDHVGAIEIAGQHRTLAEAAWRRGLMTIARSSVYDSDTRRDEIAGTRDYYTLVLLLNSGCNLVCSYCYLGHAAPTRDHAMGPDVARSAIRAALEQPWPGLLIDFGEVAVAEHALRDLLPWARRRAQERGKRLQASIQTNGTTLGPQLADFLAEYQVTVGISIDGPRDVHDAARRFRSGAGSYDRAVGAIGRCRERGLPVHLITTVTRRNVGRPAEVLAEIDQHRPGSFLLKPVLAQGEAASSWDAEGISAAQFVAFMTQMVQRADVGGADRLDQSARKFLLRLLGDRGGWRDSCTSRYCGSGRSLHVVSADGGLHACPRFVAPAAAGTLVPSGAAGASDRPLLQIGHPPDRRPPDRHQEELPQVSDLALADLLPAALRTPPASCDGCSWLGSCGGGCTLAGQDGSRAMPLPDPACSGYMAIHATLFGTVIRSFLDGRHRGTEAFNGAQPREVSP
jgi:sulfatase maturation enzyme AslB (radical SAM superfamily)